MKSLKRIITWILIIGLLFSDSYIIALAEVQLKLPLNLRIIEEEAFYGDKSIDKVTLEENTSEIRARAFANSSLSEINLPDSISFIDETAFYGLDNVKMNANKDSYGCDWALSHHYSLTGLCGDNVTWLLDGQGVLTISGKGNMNNFEECPFPSEYVKKVIIDSGITRIGTHAFQGCNRMEDIVIPDSVKSINSYAFSGCTELSNVDIPASVTSLGASVFRECSSLESVNIPEGIKTLNSYSFYKCVNLISITIPDSVTSISYNVFQYCESLNKIVIPNSVTSIGASAFVQCVGLTEIVMPEGLQRIGNSAFQMCTGLTSITIPASVQSIGKSAFYGCSNLKDLYLYDVSAWMSIECGNNDSNPNRYASSFYVNGEILNSLDVPAGTTSIRNYAFRNCQSLTQINLPKSVVEIGELAFGNCTNLKDVYYAGTEQEAKEITINANNKYLNSATWHYYYTVSDISLDQNEVVLAVGDSETLSASVIPANATNKTINWISADTSVATVSEDGIVNGVAKGATTITAITEDGGYTATCEVKVYNSLDISIKTTSGSAATSWVKYVPTAATNTYIISSEAPWTAESDSPWITTSISDDKLSVKLAKNDTGEERIGTVTVTNGVNTAVLTVIHSCITSKPTITFEPVLSSDINNPTVIPAMDLKFSAAGYAPEAKHLYMRVYKLQESGQYTRANSNTGYWSIDKTGSVTLKPNLSYCTYSDPGTYKLIFGEKTELEYTYSKWTDVPSARQVCFYFTIPDPNGFEYSVTSRGIVITGYNGEESALAIPETIGEIPIVTIGAYALKNNPTVTKIILPERLYEIQTGAFANSSLMEINLPSTIRRISDDAFDGPDKLSITATEGTYAYDWAVQNGYITLAANTFTIDQITCNKTGTALLDEPIVWSVQTLNAAGDVLYTYILYKDGIMYDHVDKSLDSFYSFIPNQPGKYLLTVSCSDEDDTIVTNNAASLTVSATALRIRELIVNKKNDISFGDAITISANVAGGNGAIQYKYEIHKDGETVKEETTVSNVYKYIIAESGRYQFFVTVSDADGAEVKDFTGFYNVYDPGQLSPSAPALIFANANISFSDTEANAPELDMGRIELKWNQVDYANGYTVSLERKNGNSWTNIFDQTITECAITLEASIFETQTSTVTYRLGMISNSIKSSQKRYYYFKVVPFSLSDAVTVDNKSTLNIYHTTGHKGDYSYAIMSDYPATVTSNVYWADATVENGLLRVYIQEDDSTHMHERKATLTINNGHSTALVNVYQVNADETPTMINYDFSTNQSSPTNYPYGDIDLTFKGNGGTTSGAVYVFDLYQLNDNGTWTRKAQQIQKEGVLGTLSIKYASSGITLGKLLRVEAKICGLSEYNAGSPQYRSNLKKNYYFKMVNSGHTIAADGTQSLNISSVGAVNVGIVANSSWTYNCDSSWISLSEKSSYSDERTNCATLSIIPTLNDTSSSRTAIITLTCGSSTASVQFTQPSCKPYVSVPALSQSESSPTILYGKAKSTRIQFVFRNIRRATWEYKSGGTYIVDEENSISCNPMEDIYAYRTDITGYQLNTLYRLTVSNGSSSIVYYFKCVEQEGFISLNGSQNDSWNPSSAGGTENYTIKSTVNWTAQSDVSWLHLSRTSGSSNSTGVSMTLTADANKTNTSRVGIITFKNNGSTMAYIRVKQNPTEYVCLYNCSMRYITSEYDDSKDLKLIDGYEDEYSLIVCTNAYRFDYSSDVDWLRVSDDEGELMIETSNNTGSTTRTGHITVTAGIASKTITVTQVPMIGSVKDAITSPVLTNTSKTNPGVLQYGDIKISWEKVTNATRYNVRLTAPNDDDFYISVNGSSQSSYTTTIPASRIGTIQSGVYVLRIYAYDAYDYYRSTALYFNFTMGDAAYIEGTTTPVWNNVTDLGDDADYIVQSSGTWTASTSQSWITVGTPSGNNGGILSITVKPNTGSARSGKVSINVNSTTTYLTVNQCAAIPEYPSLSSPAYSIDKSNPTIIPGSTTSIKMVWNVEPQANRYEVEIWQYSSTTLGSKVIGSGSLTNSEGQYTFTNLSLTKGQLYWIEFSRRNKRVTRSKRYYFMLDPGNSFVKLDGTTTQVYEDDARGGGTYYSIESSGIWTAKSNANWLTVGKTYVDEDYLEEREHVADDHLIHYGQNGDTLYLYMFPNNTGASRTATVTVTTGNATSTISIKQEKQYTTAALTSPSLGAHPSESVDVSFGSMKLNWSASASSTGKYEVLLYQSDTKNGSGTRVYRKTGLTSLSLTIPESTFAEGKYYRIWLGSEIESGDEYDNGHNYYFYMGYKNELTPISTVDWQYAAIGGRVDIRTSATGGEGTYKYVYELLRDGEKASITTWMTDTFYNFPIDQAGAYQVRVYVQDGSGVQKNVLSDAYNVSASAQSTTPAVTPTTSAERYSLMGYVVSNVGVGINGVLVYVVDTQNNDNLLGSAMTDASGRWYVDNLPACTSASLNFYSSEYEIANNGYRISITSSKVLNPFYATLISTVSTEKAIAFTAPANGSTVPYNVTLELTWSKVDGASKYLYSARWIDQEDAFIYRKSTTETSASISASQMQSGKTLQLWVGAFDRDENQLCQQIIRVITEQDNTSTEQGMVEIESIEDKGNGEISVNYVGHINDIPIEQGVLYGTTSDCAIKGEDPFTLIFGEISSRATIKGLSNGSIYYVKAYICLQDGTYYESRIETVIPGGAKLTTGYFTMKQNSKEVSQVKAGENVDFVVDVPGASTVQIVVDGKAYESYAVTNDRVSFASSFGSSGTRTIQFRPHNLTGWGDLTEAKTLTVTSVGTLSAPTIKTIGTQIMMQDAPISWNAVTNASYYTVYLYHNDVQLWPSDSNPWESRTSNTNISIPGMWLAEEGTYYVSIVASGTNYNSATGNAAFTVRPTEQAVEITYPTTGGEYNIGDTMHTNVACYKKSMYTRLRVVDPDGEITDYNPDSNGVFYPVAEKPGTYKLTAFASSKSAFTYEGREATSTTVSVTVKGPAVTSVVDRWGNDYAVAFTNDTTWLTATINCDGEIEAFVDNVSKGKISPTEEGGREYKFSVGKLSDGAHKIKFTVTYNEYSNTSSTITLYSITKANSVVRYASQTTRMETYPGSNSGYMLSYGDQVTVEGYYGGNYAYVTDGTYWRFVKKAVLVESISIDSTDVTSVDYPDDKVVYTGKTIQYQITTGDQIKKARALLLYTDVNGNYLEKTIDGVKNSGKYTISIPVDKEGDYYVVVEVESPSGEKAVLPEYSTEYTGITKISGNNNVYRKQTSSSSMIYTSPTSTILVNCEVDFSMPLKVLGSWGSDWMYISYTAANGKTTLGFVNADSVQNINPIGRKRGYIIISKDMTTEEKSKYAAAMNKARIKSMFSGLGIDTYVVYDHATATEMDDVLRRIAYETTEIDTSYIYIYAHGVHVGIDLLDDFELIKSIKLGDDEYQDQDIMNGIKKGKGKIVLMVESCFSGRFSNMAKEMGLDKNRFTVLTASHNLESSWFYNSLEDYGGAWFTTYLWDICIPPYMADSNSDGLITLSEIESKIPAVIFRHHIDESGNTIHYSEEPQYYGNTYNIVYNYNTQ